MVNGIICIDCRSRNLAVFSASVTRAQADNEQQLVVRHALDMGYLGELLESTEQQEYISGGHVVVGEYRKVRRFFSKLPVLLLGSFQAKSSQGFVDVLFGNRAFVEMAGSQRVAFNDHRKVLVVGGLGRPFGKGGLKVLSNPIEGVLIEGPIEVSLPEGAGNLNEATAAAACAGAELLASVSFSSVFVIEGQSNYSTVYRFSSRRKKPEIGGKMYSTFPPEHREEMFCRENIVRHMLFAAARWHLSLGGSNPSQEELEMEARRRLETYFLSRKAGENAYWEKLGRKFGSLNMCSEAIEATAKELGVV